MKLHSQGVCVCVFSHLALVASNYIKGALFQGPGLLNAIKPNMLSFVVRYLSCSLVSVIFVVCRRAVFLFKGTAA